MRLIKTMMLCVDFRIRYRLPDDERRRYVSDSWTFDQRYYGQTVTYDSYAHDD